MTILTKQVGDRTPKHTVVLISLPPVVRKTKHRDTQKSPQKQPDMAIAAAATATVSAQLACSARRNISLSSSYSLLSPHLPTLTSNINSLRLSATTTNPNPSFRISSMSSSVQTPETISQLSFLDRRESSASLHFVKYHGLGNDFILVISLFFLLLI